MSGQGKFAAIVAFAAPLGAIYGDIGTSPLYVMTGIFGVDSPPAAPDVVGAVSCIVWSLTLVPLVKYCFIVLRAGNDLGEGGTFVLYMTLSRFLGLGPRRDIDDDSMALTSCETTDSQQGTYIGKKRKQSYIAKSVFFRTLILIWTLIGASFVMSDGLLTPAVSVISAVGGIAIPAPQISDNIVPISIAVLVVLFLAQRFGTSKVSTVFSPIVLLWMMSLMGVGLYNIVQYPAIFAAFNPGEAFNFLIRTQDYTILGGVVLAITGVEAMFADLGHFTRISIQVNFACIVYPSLVIAYLGQGASLVVDPTRISNTFYNSIPGVAGSPLYWIVFVLATLATIIASQAMISGTFSIIHQAISLDCFPPIRVVHTSAKKFGQIYVPLVNYALMVIIVLICVGFGTSANLTNAYGFCVATVMFVTTTLLSLDMYCVWGFLWIVPSMFLLFFGAIDIAFLGATIAKIPQGAWFPVMTGALLVIFMSVWRWVAGLKLDYSWKNRVHIDTLFSGFPTTSDDFVRTIKFGDNPIQFKSSIVEDVTSPEVSDSESIAVKPLLRRSDDRAREVDSDLRLRSSDTPIIRLQGISIFYTTAPMRSSSIPHSMAHFLLQFPTLHTHSILLQVRITSRPHVAPEERFILFNTPLKIPGVHRAILQVGYMDHVVIDDEMEMKLREQLGARGNIVHIVEQIRVVAKHCDSRIMYWLRRIVINSFWAPVDESLRLGTGWTMPLDRSITVASVAQI